MKLLLLVIGYLISGVSADITTDPAIRFDIQAITLSDGGIIMNMLETYAREIAVDHAQSFIPDVNDEQVITDTRNLGASFVLADLQEQQNFAYYIYPLECQPTAWYDVLSYYAPERLKQAVNWWLSTNHTEPYSLQAYNDAITEVYKMYAAQMAGLSKENSQNVIVINNWPPPEPCPRPPVSTNTVFGPIAGTQTLTNTNSDRSLR